MREKNTRARYAVWQGDRCLAVGTMAEICLRFNVKESTFKFWMCPSCRKRGGTQKVAERL